MEPQGKPGMQGIFGILLIVGGIILVLLVLRDLAGAGGGISTANVGGGPTAPHVPGLVVQTGLFGTGSGIMNASTSNVTGQGATAPHIPGQVVQTPIKPCWFGFINC